MPADAVIMAFGFHPHGMPWLESHGVKVDNWGALPPMLKAHTVTKPVTRKSLPVATRYAVRIWW